MSDQPSALIDECNRQSENCSYAAAAFTIWLRWLRRFRVIANLAPVVFGALATWKIVAQNSPIWAAVFTFLATVIPLVYRAARVDHAIEEYTKAGGEFTNLRDRFRLAAQVASQKPFSEFEAQVSPLLDRLERIRACVLTPPEWCFLLARRKHRAGHYVHDYDERLPGSLD